jgi:dienelactone hydrolase
MRLTASPQRAPLDVPVSIRLSELAPGERVTVRARLATYFDGGTWASEATFVADAAGTIDPARDAPIAGSYDGVEPSGLFWSMRRRGQSDTPFDGTRPLQVTLTAEAAEGSGATTIGSSAAGATATGATETLERLVVPDGLVQRRVREQGLVGTFFRPDRDGTYPGVLVMGGSGGGIGGAYWQAALLARHGFATLALAYFAMESLPEHLTSIPLEYFQTAISWLTAQPGVQDDGVGVIGTSRGGELVLLLGATYPQITAVVGYVPSHVVWRGFGRGLSGPVPSWTLAGEPVTWMQATLPPDTPPPSEPIPGVPHASTPNFLRSLKDPEAEARAAIPVERINGPVLLISGQDDQMWPSSLMAGRAAERLAAHHHPYAVEHLDYANVGHSIFLPSLPTSVTIQVHPVNGVLNDLGGSPRATAHAAVDSWPRLVQFLGESL